MPDSARPIETIQRRQAESRTVLSLLARHQQGAADLDNVVICDACNVNITNTRRLSVHSPSASSAGASHASPPAHAHPVVDGPAAAAVARHAAAETVRQREHMHIVHASQMPVSLFIPLNVGLCCRACCAHLHPCTHKPQLHNDGGSVWSCSSLR